MTQRRRRGQVSERGSEDTREASDEGELAEEAVKDSSKSMWQLALERERVRRCPPCWF